MTEWCVVYSSFSDFHDGDESMKPWDRMTYRDEADARSEAQRLERHFTSAGHRFDIERVEA